MITLQCPKNDLIREIKQSNNCSIKEAKKLANKYIGICMNLYKVSYKRGFEKMKCNCIKDLEKRILEKELKRNSKFNDDKARCKAENMAFIFDKGSTTTKPYQTFTIEEEYKTKTGKIRTRKESQNVIFTYCPYCGKEI